MKLAIFGAQGYALGAFEAIKTIHDDWEIPFFMVSRMDNNPYKLAGIPVREAKAVSTELVPEEKESLTILIATPENVQEEIEDSLKGLGFINIKRLDFKLWDDLMKEFHSKIRDFIPLSEFPSGKSRPSLEIYMAKFHKDKPLKNPPEHKDYIVPLQVGAANTEDRICSLTDNSGENISVKNVNYCELTGLYWLWKNKLCTPDNREDEKEYFGLAQYRRLFVLSDDDLSRLKENDIDVLLPYPMPYEPDINAHHERYIKDVDWQALLHSIKELQPEYAEAFQNILSQKYLYNYNVILAKKDVLRDYCEWLFPILERAEELSVPKGSERADRYIGYMGETLETLYFMKNADKLKIAHAGCKLYV